MEIQLYHSVSNLIYGFTESEFETIFKLLDKRRQTGEINIVNLRTYLEKPDKKNIAITFDDCFEEWYTVIFPLIKKYNIPVTFFVITSKLDTKLIKMFKEMVISGLCEFQSHTHNHIPFLNMTEEQIIEEITVSKEIIENNLNKCSYVSFPGGGWPGIGIAETVGNIARSLFIENMFTSFKFKLDKINNYFIPRVAVMRTDKKNEKVTKKTKLANSSEFILNHKRFKGKILEIGPRFGHFAIKANLTGKDVTALELDLSNLIELTELQKKSGSNVKLIYSDLMNGINGKYDTINMSKVLEHLDNPEKGISITLNSLKKGGTLFISTPCGCAHFDNDHKHFFFPRKEYSFLQKTWLVNQNCICLEDMLDKFNVDYSVLLIDWHDGNRPSLDFLVIVKCD